MTGVAGREGAGVRKREGGWGEVRKREGSEAAGEGGMRKNRGRGEGQAGGRRESPR